MAGSRIVSICLIDGIYHYTEIDRRGSMFYPQQARTTTSVEALTAVCRGAGEIYLSSLFSTEATTYQRILLPKVARKHLPALVRQDAAEKMGVALPVTTRFKILKEVADAGVTKWQVGYCAVLEKELLEFWNTFKPFRKKIRFFSPLPLAVVAMVSQLAEPEKNFTIIWVGENNSLLIIGSPEGLVYVARSVPLGLTSRRLQLMPVTPPPETQPPAPPPPETPAPLTDDSADDTPIDIELETLELMPDDQSDKPDKPDKQSEDQSPEGIPGQSTDRAGPLTSADWAEIPTLPDGPEAPQPFERPSRQDRSLQQHDDMITAGDFARRLEKELSMTSTFFKQEFREPAPNRVYLLGNANLKSVLEFYPLPALYDQVILTLNTAPHKGLSPQFISENIHVAANLFLSETFSFIPEQELLARKTNLLLNVTGLVLLAGIGLSVFWAGHLHATRAATLQTHQQQLARLSAVQADVARLQTEVSQLKPIEGWKQFYDSTVADKPPWNRFITELATRMEDHVLITSFQVLAGEGRERNCRMQGKIRAENWEAGLELFRQFGRELQASPLFVVKTIQYAPEGIGTDPSTFDFQMDITLKHTGGAS